MGCGYCGFTGLDEHPEASSPTAGPSSVVEVPDSPLQPKQARLLGNKETPASTSRTSSINKDQAIKDSRPHAGSRATFSTVASDRTKSNDSGVTASNTKTVITPRYQYYDPASQYDLEPLYTGNHMWGTYLPLLI